MFILNDAASPGRPASPGPGAEVAAVLQYYSTCVYVCACELHCVHLTFMYTMYTFECVRCVWVIVQCQEFRFLLCYLSP